MHYKKKRSSANLKKMQKVIHLAHLFSWNKQIKKMCWPVSYTVQLQKMQGKNWLMQPNKLKQTKHTNQQHTY